MPYSFRFSSNAPYRYKPGSLFLGVDPERGYEVGIETDRHAITIAGSRAGKGAALMIPNLKRWPHNALVIDPKGEAAEETAEDRARMGQDVRLLDPFHVVRTPELQRFKAKFNPLRSITRGQIGAREDVNVLSDGLLLRADPRAGHWDGGGLTVLSGLIAYVLDMAPPELRTLPQVRKILTETPENFAQVVHEMETNDSFGNLPAAAASKLQKSGSEAAHFLSVADENTKWLDSPDISNLLSDSTFELSDLKTKPCTVFLVLPANMIGEHGRFLRLFVRMAINAMAKGGTAGGRRCLFMLDEFFSLGHIEEIAKAAGLMPGYGVHLWPILQDLGQLETLYGREGAQTFFGNADVHIFFGNTDPLTLKSMSERVGIVLPEDIDAKPPQVVIDNKVIVAPTAPFQPPMEKLRPEAASVEKSFYEAQKLARLWEQERHVKQQEWYNKTIARMHKDDKDKREKFDNEMREYSHAMADVGKARLPADKIRDHVKKIGPNAPSRDMIVFAPGDDVLSVRLKPYFQAPVVSAASATAAPVVMGSAASSSRARLVGLSLFVIAWAVSLWGQAHVPDGLPTLALVTVALGVAGLLQPGSAALGRPPWFFFAAALGAVLVCSFAVGALSVTMGLSDKAGWLEGFLGMTAAAVALYYLLPFSRRVA